MNINLTTCPNCGVVIDFHTCCELYGWNDEWSRGSDMTRVTMCPVCKHEVPEKEGYSNIIRAYKKMQREDV